MKYENKDYLLFDDNNKLRSLHDFVNCICVEKDITMLELGEDFYNARHLLQQKLKENKISTSNLMKLAELLEIDVYYLIVTRHQLETDARMRLRYGN